MENKTKITVESSVNATIEKVWMYWTTPKHIEQWHNASEDWYTPKASNDLKKGGKFVYTMAAKDGSFSFDFGGTYTEIIENKSIKYLMEDGRTAAVEFISIEKTVKIIEIFDAEDMNPIEMQQDGWQAILNNFKKYVENN